MSNYFKTGLLLAVMTALFMWVGYMIGGQSGMLLALGFAVVMNVSSWWFSDKIVLKMYKAEPVTQGKFYDMVYALAQNARMPMPKVYIIPNKQPNAFATGRSPQYAAVAATQGIMDILTERELRGVMAHELAHIKNRDTLTMVVTATIAGAIGMLANMAMFMGGSRDRQGGALAMIVIMILAPLAASIVQMTISRVREYGADKGGAEISGDPLALASALKKIDAYAKGHINHTAENNPATAHMFIINPLGARKSDNLFSTHPATQNRIAALEKLADNTLPKDQNPWD